MEVIILGTSSAIPTKDRNHTAVLLKYGGEKLLFDCGEGTQRQLRVAEENPMKITKVFITHWHGDHVLGLIGLLQTLAFNQGKVRLEVYGPEGTKQKVKDLLRVYEIGVSYNLVVKDVVFTKGESVCVAAEGDSYIVRAAKMKHSVECIAYAFEENPKYKIRVDYIHRFGLEKNAKVEDLRAGKDVVWNGKKLLASEARYAVASKKFAYIVDTAETAAAVELARGADLLVCEGTFANALKEKTQEYGHLTAKQAGKLAKKADVKKLVITHFSQRYKDVKPLVEEARKKFSNTVAAKDFMSLRI